MNVVAGESMNSQSQILFNKTLEEARRLGARGGRAHARNLRARSALLDALPVTPSIVPLETTAEATPSSTHSSHGFAARRNEGRGIALRNRL